MNLNLIGLILKKKNLLNLAHPYEARGAYYNSEKYKRNNYQIRSIHTDE